MGEIDYEIVVGVIHHVFAMVFFVAILGVGFPPCVFMENGLYCPPLMNIP
jgi:hypothetical protein